jgi:DNA-directed RNA polymerase subunit N (RpoN/RPB10)
MTRSAARFWWKEELPKNVIYMYRSGYIGSKWEEYTVEEHNAKKKEKQENNIRRKRYCLRRVPCFIHVFRVNTDFLFGGFYIVVWSVYGTWYLNWKTYYKHKNFLPRIKQRLNIGFLPLIDNDTWFREFCKTYPMKPKGIQNPRGKYLTHCIIDSNNNLIDIELEGESL